MNNNIIDWYAEKMPKKKMEKILSDNEECFCWTDIITHTKYAISQTKYEEIYRKGCKELECLLKANDVEGMEAIIYSDPSSGDEMALFSQLPYQSADHKTQAYRVRDFICLRTAFLYAVRYAEHMKCKSENWDKDAVRLQGFTWGFVNQEKLCPELENIEKALLCQSSTLSQHPVDIVKGGMVKIKQYFLETNRIPEIRGASRLLDYVNDKKMCEEISKKHIRECLVYAGGGKMLGIFPVGTGQKICEDLETLVEEYTVTAQSNFYSMRYTIEDLVDQERYKEVMEEMDMQLEKHQGLRWDFRLEPQVPGSEVLNSKAMRYKDNPERELCDSCRHRNAIFITEQNPQLRLCQSCLHKNIYGGKDAKKSISEQYREFVKNKYNITLLDDKEYNTLADIAGDENGFIGIIYGDANNMSVVVEEVQSLMEMKYFSEMTSDAITQIVFSALKKHLKRKPAFEIISLGGDDIFLIVPGKQAYEIGCTIGQEFDKKFSNQSLGKCNMTMSLGVCINHAKLPILYTFETAQKLLKSAKQTAWEESVKEENNKMGTIDWMVIENESGVSSSLKKDQQEICNKPRKTLRPYTYARAEEIRKFVHAIEEEKTLAFQLRQSWFMHGEKEGKLFYQYQLAHNESEHKENKIPLALGKLAQALGGQPDGSNIRIDGELYSPWVDAIELWDYVGEVLDEEV